MCLDARQREVHLVAHWEQVDPQVQAVLHTPVGLQERADLQARADLLQAQVDLPVLAALQVQAVHQKVPADLQEVPEGP